MSVLMEVLCLIWYVIKSVMQGMFYAVIPKTYESWKNVHGTLALVTGAGGGLGRLMCHEFAKRGATVVALDINKETNDETKDQIVKKGGVCYAYQCNVGDRNAVFKVAEKVKREVGCIDFLVNNAGVVSGESLLDLTEEQIERTMKVNLFSNFWTVKAFLPDMMERRTGHIVTIASIAGIVGGNKLTDYCSSKFGAVGFAESLESELRAGGYDDIHTTTVCPSVIDTGMFDGCEIRFPSILGILEPEATVKRIMEAIYTNQKILYLPRAMYLLALLKHMLPVDASYKIGEFFGAPELMTNFRGHAKKD